MVLFAILCPTVQISETAPSIWRAVRTIMVSNTATTRITTNPIASDTDQTV